MIWMVTTCSKSKAVRISLIYKGLNLKVQSHYASFHSIFIRFFFSFYLLPTKIAPNDTLGRKSKSRYVIRLRIWKWIENMDDSVRFSNDVLMRFGTSITMTFYSTLSSIWIDFIDWKLVINSYTVSTSKIDFDRLTWASWLIIRLK